ncbi:MAG: threonine ammonia-lyase [Acidaminococcales bacterium]|jgi:threonine dehydratase|nr:threonine ammonia-lyase [Acidaminococcales bacterium]
MKAQDFVALGDIKAAAERLGGVIKCTPLEYNNTFSLMSGSGVYLKLENLQRTGSFKVRGAYNCIQAMDGERRACGVITASAGNHAQGVALGAAAANVPATIVMPENTPLPKVAATRGYGAKVIQAGVVYDDSYEEALRLQKEQGLSFVHAFDDMAVIAGQGTIGLEMMRQRPDIEAVVVPVGGGGLIAGIAAAIKIIAPHVKVYGVQASGAPSAYLSRNAGRPVEAPGVHTLADGIAVKKTGEITFRHIQRYVDDIFVVKDEDIAATILLLLERSKLVAEGAGAVGLAAILHNLVPHHERTATVISGGNIDINFVSRIIENGLIKAGRRIKLETDLVDRPGELRKFITTIAEHQANIVYIYHEHAGKNLPIGYTNVEMDLETRDAKHAEAVVASLRQAGYKVEVF